MLKNDQVTLLRLIKSKGETLDFGKIQPLKKLSLNQSISIYRDDYESRHSSVLFNHYKSVAQLIGHKEFSFLASKYNSTYPSSSTDLDDYGDEFVSFLRLERSARFTKIADFAELDFEFRRLFHSSVEPALTAQEIIASLQDKTDLFEANFFFTKNLFLRESSYSLHFAWENSDSVSLKNLPEAPESFIMYNTDGTVRVKVLSFYQYRVFLKLLYPQNSLKIEDNNESQREVQALFNFLSSAKLITAIR